MSEFSYVGDAGYRRPDAAAAPGDFYEAVYLRDNPAGAHYELWYHTYGCRAFLRAHRDTRTHAILGVELARRRDPT